ncbi:hypothetical protein WA026_017450 [Henosepilachna vigintioctopunctata]|uniref:Uncharacterized protein n=1 Tax=Henosepilachna vigintioctopunctata TaxID=420089 RepID=A0AAW1VG18_9CUCU
MKHRCESWYCEICNNEESRKPPPQQSPKNYTPNDVMTKLEKMDKKYNSLFKQYSEQITIHEELKREVGVPYEDNENIKSMIKKKSEDLEIGLSEDQFTAFKMGKDTSLNCPIKVTLTDEQIKEDILRSRSKTSLTTQKINSMDDESTL